MRTRSAAKQDIDCRTVPVFAWATRKYSYVVLNRQMTICRSAVNAAPFVAFLMFGNRSWEISAATQNAWQHRFGADVQDDKDRRVEVLGQVLVELAKSLHAPGRSADHDDIAFSHGEKRPLINESPLTRR